MADKVVGLGRLARFKQKEVERTEATYAKKGETAGIATADKAGIIKPGPDFDVSADGTLSQYIKIAVNSFTCSPWQAERGATVDDVTLAWALNKTPKSLDLDGEAQEVTATSKKVTGAGIKANKIYTLKATDARDAVATKTAGVSFLDKRHWFVAGDLDAAGVTDDVINEATGELATGRAKSFTVTAGDGQHIYYAFPASWGTPRFFVGGFEGGFSLLKTFDHVNASGATVSYVVWKSTNAGLGKTSVEVRQ